MLRYRVFIPMAFENDAHFAATIGTHVLDNGGQVVVTGIDMRVDVVRAMAFEGTLPDVLAVVMKEWEDDDLAVQAFAEAAAEGRMELM